jgi:hypothetical protein
MKIIEHKVGDYPMSSKFAFGWLLAVVICLAFLPHASRAADWNLSPYRAQLAEGPTAEQAPVSEETIPMNSQKKVIGKGIMFSLIIPGAGQMYAGSWMTAVPFFALEVASWAAFASYHNKGTDQTSKFEAYAGARETPNNFDTRAYLFAEYSVATDTNKVQGRPVYHADYATWTTLPWEHSSSSGDDRYSHLPAPFTHDIMTGDRQQFFEMIGKYIGQFGFGWKDTHTQTTNGTDPNSWTFNWAQPAAGVTADDPNTTGYDGGSPMFFQYRDMRGKANDYLNTANIGMEVVLANHILSALHAAILVHNYNKNLPASAPSSKIGSIGLHYDARMVNGSLTRSINLTVPLN